MPLFKRKPFALVESPSGLDPHELVFQIRFTKEIFQDYQEYLKRINLYRQRVWTCKVTGKTNLTYEEALVSEQRATEKVQQLPKELIAPALQIIQFSRLPLRDLVNKITAKLQESLLEGVVLYGRKDKDFHLCKILRVLEEDDKIRYEVGWLNKDMKVTDSSIVNGTDLRRKRLPFNRDVLKSFVRESTYQSSPWVLHDKLARKHGISTEPPEELTVKISVQNGCLVSNGQTSKNKKGSRNILEAKKSDLGKDKRKILETKDPEGLKTVKKAKKEEELKEEHIKYPIDDLLVKSGDDDPIFTDRPAPSREFRVPVDCVGDLLMVWDFCSSFSRLLHLWTFSLEDFENAICHKDSDLILIAESHLALLRLLVKDKGKYFMAIQKKRPKLKINLMNWTEYLCDLLGMGDIPELVVHIVTIKRGYYGRLDVHAKLDIFRELVSCTLETNAIREQLDEYIEQQQALSATKREEALEEGRRRREEKELKKIEFGTSKFSQGHNLENGGNIRVPESCYGSGQKNGNVPRERDEKDLSSTGSNILENNESEYMNSTSKIAKKPKIDVEITAENAKDSSGTETREALKQKENKKEAIEKKSKEQRKQKLEQEIEKRFIRTNPLGRDRNYNRYWFFRRDGRIFVESSDSKLWGYYSSKEELDALMGSLNCKGERERALRRQLEKYYARMCSALQKRSKEVAQKIALEEAVLRRSTRVRATPRVNPAMAFLKYVNRWKGGRCLLD